MNKVITTLGVMLLLAAGGLFAAKHYGFKIPEFNLSKKEVAAPEPQVRIPLPGSIGPEIVTPLKMEVAEEA